MNGEGKERKEKEKLVFDGDSCLEPLKHGVAEFDLEKRRTMSNWTVLGPILQAEIQSWSLS